MNNEQNGHVKTQEKRTESKNKLQFPCTLYYGHKQAYLFKRIYCNESSYKNKNRRVYVAKTDEIVLITLARILFIRT